jgi:hypothetical protein
MSFKFAEISYWLLPECPCREGGFIMRAFNLQIGPDGSRHRPGLPTCRGKYYERSFSTVSGSVFACASMAVPV